MMENLGPEFAEPLRRSAGQMGVDLAPEQVNRLLDYLALLIKWNKAYNLTAIREPLQMLSRHLYDSISVAPFVTADQVLDVGTGPGLPGIPLALIYPQRSFHLLDSNGKKTRFLTQCKIELGLPNVSVYHQRVEAHPNRHFYGQIVSRAFASLTKMVDLCKHCLAQDGEFLAMKGRLPDDEIEILKQEFTNIDVRVLNVPELNEERHLIKISRC